MDFAINGSMKGQTSEFQKNKYRGQISGLSIWFYSAIPL